MISVSMIQNSKWLLFMNRVMMNNFIFLYEFMPYQTYHREIDKLLTVSAVVHCT